MPVSVLEKSMDNIFTNSGKTYGIYRIYIKIFPKVCSVKIQFKKIGFMLSFSRQKTEFLFCPEKVASRVFKI